jgi:hypothetical protein
MMWGSALPHGEWRFLQLTLFIGAWMLLSPLMKDRWITQVLLQAFLLNSVLVTLWANPAWHAVRRLMLAVWIVSLAGSLLVLSPLSFEWQRAARTVEIASTMPLLALLAVGILQFVFRGKSMTTDGLFATVAVYVLIALFFAQLYLLLLEWNSASFNLDVAGRSPQQLQSDMLYFSLVTLATVGYGDILPVTTTARTLAVIEAAAGQFYIAAVVAVFVSMYAAQRRSS